MHSFFFLPLFYIRIPLKSVYSQLFNVFLYWKNNRTDNYLGYAVGVSFP